MERQPLRGSCQRLWTVVHRPRTTCSTIDAVQRRSRTTQIISEPRAAAPFVFTDNYNQFNNLRSRAPPRDGILDQIHAVPASPSYFTGSPVSTDDFLEMYALIQRYRHLPLVRNKERTSWITYEQYVTRLSERVKHSRFVNMMSMVQRLAMIHDPLMPEEVTKALERFKRAVQPRAVGKREIVVDRYGRTRGVGRRKASSAECQVIEGDGEILINGRTLTNYFGKLRDRESAIWALKATNRADKYNAWVRTSGGGTTGQAEAIQLGIAKALLAQEPALEPMLKRAGVLRRDPRTVERKKPGKLKARKMPAWVKR